MKKRKLALQTKGKNDIYHKVGIIRISKEENEYFFEIGSDVTSDVAEAVAMMMRKIDWDDPVWDLEINDFIIENTAPEKSLFWLSGGYNEWRTLENYNRPWCDCYLDFQEEFGYLIVNIIKRTKTLGGIKDNFIKHLNLPILYDFAISKNMIK